MPDSHQPASASASIRIYRRARSEFWWVDVRLPDGRRHRQSTGTRDRRQAEDIAYEVRQSALAAPPDDALGGEAGDPLDLALLGGLDMMRAESDGVGPRQREALEAGWRHVCRLIPPSTLASTINYRMMQNYVSVRRKEGARGQSITREVAAVCRGLREARRQGIYRGPMPEWPKVRHDPKDRAASGKLHPADTLTAWLEALAQEDQATGAREQAELVLRTGLRAQEVRRLCLSWIEAAPPEAGVPALLRIPAEATKTRRERVIGLTAQAMALLDACRERLAEQGDVPIFPSDHKRAFRNAAAKVESPRITLRDLRHCHATWAAQGTGDAAAAQAALGHADLRTTQRYLTATLARVSSAAIAVGAMVEGPKTAAGSLTTASPEAPGHSLGAQSGCPIWKRQVVMVGLDGCL